MKKISELTEKEIYALTPDEVALMIKLRKAEEGIRLIEKPLAPSYFNVPEPDRVIYSCFLFGDTLVFEDVEEINTVISAISKANSKRCVEYDWNKATSDHKYIKNELKGGYGTKWDTVTTVRVYSPELYLQVAEQIAQNKKMKDKYEADLKEYDGKIKEALWVESEINDRVSEIQEKFWKMEDYARRFKLDYLPLSENNEEVAMKFLNKAYSLNDEEKAYVLENYSAI